MSGFWRLVTLVLCLVLGGCSAMRSEVAVTYQTGDCSVTARAWR